MLWSVRCFVVYICIFEREAISDGLGAVVNQAGRLMTDCIVFLIITVIESVVAIVVIVL